MPTSIDRRTFLKRAGTTAAVALVGAPLLAPSRVGAGDRLVVAVGQWGIETPFAWRSSQSEKTLWDCMHDPLIMRDPKTFGYVPGLATEWKPSNELRTWTFKLRSGVQFHEGFGEMTAEDVKFTVEQNLRPDVPGGSAPFFRAHLERIETPDKYTVVMHFKNRVWEVPSNFTQFVGYQNITSKKYIESVGEDKAALHPIGTGPYRHVEGKQGDYHRFEAVGNHWRKTPIYRELIVRRIPDPATRLAGLRSGEIDIGNVFGDYLDQARKAGLRIHEAQNAACHWVVLQGQTTPDREDYCPACPWAGDPKDPKSQDNARKVRLALNLAVDKQAIMQRVLGGLGTVVGSWLSYPSDAWNTDELKKPYPYDPTKAKALLAEAGYPNGFEVTMNLTAWPGRGYLPDVGEAVATYWERIGLKVKRRPVDRAVFASDFRKRAYAGVALAYAGPIIAPEPWELFQRIAHSKSAVPLFPLTTIFTTRRPPSPRSAASRRS